MPWGSRNRQRTTAEWSDKEHDGMRSDEVSVCLGEAAIGNEQQLNGVDKDADELDHLHVGHVPLPPDVLLVLRPQSGKHVVGVHEEVDNAVEEAKEGCVTAGSVPQTWPNTERHDSVVNHMQGGHVVELFPRHKSKRINEFGEL